MSSEDREAVLKRDMENAQARVRHLRNQVQHTGEEYARSKQNLAQAEALEQKLRREWTAAALDSSW